AFLPYLCEPSRKMCRDAKRVRGLGGGQAHQPRRSSCCAEHAIDTGRAEASARYLLVEVSANPAEHLVADDDRLEEFRARRVILFRYCEGGRHDGGPGMG